MERGGGDWTQTLFLMSSPIMHNQGVTGSMTSNSGRKFIKSEPDRTTCDWGSSSCQHLATSCDTLWRVSTPTSQCSVWSKRIHYLRSIQYGYQSHCMQDWADMKIQLLRGLLSSPLGCIGPRGLLISKRYLCSRILHIPPKKGPSNKEKLTTWIFLIYVEMSPMRIWKSLIDE